MSPRAPEEEVRDEASGFAAYLSYYREEIAEAVLALTPEQQRTSAIPSGWTPIELLSHVLHMEQRWFVWGFLNQPVTDPWGDWSAPEPWEDDADPPPRWQVPDDVSAEMLVARLRELGARVTEILAAHDLDEVPAHGPRWDHTDAIPPLRWICFHVLEEYARHAGHLDIAVELAGAREPAG